MTKQDARVLGRAIFYALWDLLIRSLLLMLVAGQLHDVYPQVPPFGFWSSVGIVILVSVLFPTRVDVKKAQ